MRLLRLTGCAAAVLLAVTACATGSGGGGSAAGEPVVIGLQVPLSPPGDATAGQLIQRGAELGVQYVNENGGVLDGRKLQLAVQDTKGQPESGVAGYRTLVTRDRAVAVTGFFHSSVNLAVNEAANSLGVPTLGTQSSAADITAKHYDAAFRTHVIDPVRVAAWLRFIEQEGYQKVAMIAEDTDYGVGLVEEMKAQAADGDLGLDLTSIIFDHKATDFTPQLLKIKASDPDLVINIGVGHPYDLILQQATTIELYPEVPMLVSYDAPVRPEFWEVHGEQGAGVYFTAYYSPQQELSEAGQWVAETYQAKYDEPAVYGSLNAFGDVIVLAQAIDDAGTTEKEQLVQALENGSFTSWTANPVTFPRADGVYWHNWAPPVLILQYTEPHQDPKDAELVVEHQESAT